ncbi:hypothetical protein [Tropicimonas sp. IMCC34011]|uniref:head-tail connector protein n=1 Tax=Tropicimonas sp. IMCC34011 TaxID=2248759 RepID=UPI0013005176|nr:hypothetical protein [Tropicimonas sp. IMCC34011]
MLTELSACPASALPVAELNAHLRLGRGFSDDGAETPLVETILRAAMAAVEAGTGLSLLARSFLWAPERWPGGASVDLPIAPIAAVTQITYTNRVGAEIPLAEDRWRLAPDWRRPRLVARDRPFPSAPQGGTVMVHLTAGFGDDWESVPADLAQAVLIQAAKFYEYRTGEAKGPPADISVLLGPWRQVRLGGRRA